ncbi:hypothetical protein F5Y02DRAFT_353360 [Annulohypoxylon stygium]|nr:hypothetical protein F5Y02DRAFT_353360 [Annulohypoxylon stygium]
MDSITEMNCTRRGPCHTTNPATDAHEDCQVQLHVIYLSMRLADLVGLMVSGFLRSRLTQLHGLIQGVSKELCGSGRGSRSSVSTSASRPPSLKTEQSSNGSVSSLSSYAVPRTPSDASLPIHALLTKPETSYAPCPAPAPQTQIPIFQPPSGRPPGDQPVTNGFHPGPSTPKFSIPSLQKESVFGMPDSKLSPTSKFAGPSDNSLDGISALLKAREIVDRQ